MKDVIWAAINDVLEELGLSGADFTVEHPTELSHGDYATNVAMAVAKLAGQNPRALADKIAEKLEGQIEYVDKIDVAGPGFINFYLSRDFFVSEVGRVIKEGERWGHSDTWKDKVVLVEYTDPNPFKEFHIGHLFTNAVGESIARLFMAQGADVRRVNYQGDVGLHVACAIYGMMKLGLSSSDELTPAQLGKAYTLGATANKEDEQVTEEIKRINKAVYERSDKEVSALYDKGRQVSLDYFETIYQMVDTKFDHYFFESEAAPHGKELVLSHPDVFPESEGARVFKGEEYGLHSRVFLNSQGLPTYEAKELALAKLKDDYVHYDHSVISTAKEINEYFKVLFKAMSFVHPELAEKTEHIGHGMVRLSTGKMSSRTGDVIPAKDFIDEIKEAAIKKMKESVKSDANEELAQDIAIGAIKYATLKGSIYQDTVFNKEQALSFEGASGPYLQYTHARINSVLGKATEAGVSTEVRAENVPPDAYEVEKILYRFPEVVEEAFLAREPHQVATFITELASSFNSFYANEKIADSSDLHTPYKCLLASAVKQTIKNGLWLLAIKAPEKM
ncbi:arginine--tRNA ligase [Candidatus Nomurabacteria bacterium]|nr:arginine--tRNA ligase [Candidatus Nomurabacteria bacterium]